METFLQCFDTVVWITERILSLYRNPAKGSSLEYVWGTWPNVEYSTEKAG